MKYLITGGAGFIGSALIRHLILVGQIIDPNWQDEGEGCASKGTNQVDEEAELRHDHCPNCCH